METEETERDLKEESQGLQLTGMSVLNTRWDKGDARSQWLMPGRTIMPVTGANSPGDSLVLLMPVKGVRN